MIDRNREPTTAELRRFIDDYVRVLREGMPGLKDSAWLYKTGRRGFGSADKPSVEMQRFIQYHQTRLVKLLKHATVFIYWHPADTVASLKIMQMPVTDEPFKTITLPFPPASYQVPYIVRPPGDFWSKGE